MRIETAFNIGDMCFCTNGSGGIKNLTIGLIRAEKKNSPGMEDSFFDNFKPQEAYKEEYMCVETGVDSGNVYTLGRNIFKSKKDAAEAVEMYNKTLE